MKLLPWLLCLAMTALAWSAVPAKKSTTKKKSTTTTTAKASTKKSPPKTGARTATAKTANSKKPAPKATTWRNRQLSPSRDRYKEIQDALATRGYLAPENATGSWNPASIDALKRFQSEQNIEASGKINSLSLIALGLGPRRDVPATPADPVGNK